MTARTWSQVRGWALVVAVIALGLLMWRIGSQPF
jgi:hypothetical protein